MEKNIRIRELIKILNEASKKYYQENEEIISNKEYDDLYDELVKLQIETGIVYANSPTKKVGYEIVSALPKMEHIKPMLSLDKTKEIEKLKEFLGEKKGLLSWKLDGLTVVLTYENGKLTQALTRGDGVVGEVITSNAKTFKNLPIEISYKEKMILRGEAIISYEDFNIINENLEKGEEKYKNPRNLCSGSIRQLNSEITSKRYVNFYAFEVVQAGEENFDNSYTKSFEFIKKLGFTTVQYEEVDKNNIENMVKYFSEAIKTYFLPSDGLVLLYDDIKYGKSLGVTAKFPKNAIAFKWKDEVVKTVLKEVLWNTSRTGLINPVAVFDEVEIESTMVSRASLHNVSILEKLKLGIGDEITVYKANMIIPQVKENLTQSNTVEIPTKCPSCNSDTKIVIENATKELYCTNKDCPEKSLRYLEHFVSKNAMNIDGLSKKRIEVFVEAGILKDILDIYELQKYRDKIINMSGFGEKSYDNIINSINISRKTTLPRLLNSLGIKNIGYQSAKIISEKFDYKIENIMNANVDDFIEIEGIGEILAKNTVEYFQNIKNRATLKRLIEYLDIQVQYKLINDEVNSKIKDKVFVITGKLNEFENRDELKEKLEEMGAKVASAVSKNTDFLINNDANSTSSKNKKAKLLGVEIITENQLLKMLE